MYQPYGAILCIFTVLTVVNSLSYTDMIIANVDQDIFFSCLDKRQNGLPS